MLSEPKAIVVAYVDTLIWEGLMSFFMKSTISILVFVGLALASAGCSTAVKIQSQGPIQITSKEAASNLAPVLMQYKFSVPNDRHVIYFFDQDRNRYDVTVPGDLDTQSGIVFYLPANKQYAMVSIYIYLKHGQEFMCGDNLDLFDLDPEKINQLPYFELRPSAEDQWKFSVLEDGLSNALYRSLAEKRFGPLSPVRDVKIKLFNIFDLR